MTILSNRVNELGVSEAIVHCQGSRNISVELPGIQDTNRAKELLEKTATLAFHLVSDDYERLTHHFQHRWVVNGTMTKTTSPYFLANRSFCAETRLLTPLLC